MRFVYMSEGDTLPGQTHQTRCRELVEEVVHAEKWGFDLFGVSEQHMAVGAATTSSPEVLYAYLYAKTSRIRFRRCISLIPVNHPLKIAANVAVADILSNGRIEVGIGRGNTTLAMRAFEVDLDTNRDKALEGIEIVKKAYTEDPFMYYGEHYKIPPRSLVPKPIRKPHPDIYMAASSVDSHQHCADLGIGTLSLSSFLGWEFLDDNINMYRKGIRKTRENGGGYVNESVGVLVHAHCDETDEMAREVAGDANLDYVHVAYSGCPRLAKMSDSYKYMGALAKVGEKINNLDCFVNDSASAVIGSPDSCIEQIERYRQAGADESLPRIDSIPHDKIMKSIEYFGRYVIPHFKHPENIVRPPEDVLNDIRAMREEAKRSAVYVQLPPKEQRQVQGPGPGARTPRGASAQFP